MDYCRFDYLFLHPDFSSITASLISRESGLDRRRPPAFLENDVKKEKKYQSLYCGEQANRGDLGCFPE